MSTLQKTTKLPGGLAEGAPSAAEDGRMVWPAQTVRFAVVGMALTAAFALPLLHLMRYSWNSLLVSYIPFVPFISAYLIALDRERLPRRTTRGWAGALIFSTLGLGLLAVYWGTIQAGAPMEQTQGLACTTAAFLFLLLAAAFFFYGAAFMRALAFPVAYCFFMVPLPNVLLDPVVDFMRTGTGWLAHTFLLMDWKPNVLEGVTLVLPNSALTITPDCSGYHAGISLLLTSLFAGRLFLNSGWNRFWLALVAVPLGIVRNAFRVFVLAEMCFHQGSQALESPVHSQGGKFFFALSLVPLFLFLIVLHKSENGRPDPGKAAGVSSEGTGSK